MTMAEHFVEGAERHMAFCRQVRAAFPPRSGDWQPEFCDVVAIVSSSRGGSSLLFDLLRTTGAFLCLEGEHSTLYKLHGLGLPPDPDSDDGCIPQGGDTPGFLSEFTADLTVSSTSGHDIEDYVIRVVRALAQQWPGSPLTPAEIWEVAHGTAARLPRARHGHVLFTIVRELRARGWLINPWYFDLPGPLIRREFPEMALPQGPPHTLTQSLEAPPFLAPRPARIPVEADTGRPLLLKASMDAYRIPFLRRLFPDARLRIIHLTRNPAAAINGMIDGWLHHGFFSHNLSGRAVLKIDGYAGSWAGSWWNFDLPPDWRRLVTQPLASVCAAQWVGAHTAIMASLPGKDAQVARVRAEDVLNAHRRRRTIMQLLEFCGVRPLAPPRARVVLATEHPRPARWRARAAQLEPVLADPVIRQCSGRLGYGPQPTADWTLHTKEAAW
jgi:hypothetical protein